MLFYACHIHTLSHGIAQNRAQPSQLRYRWIRPRVDVLHIFLHFTSPHVNMTIFNTLRSKSPAYRFALGFLVAALIFTFCYTALPRFFQAMLIHPGIVHPPRHEELDDDDTNNGDEVSGAMNDRIMDDGDPIDDDGGWNGW